MEREKIISRLRGKLDEMHISYHMVTSTVMTGLLLLP